MVPPVDSLASVPYLRIVKPIHHFLPFLNGHGAVQPHVLIPARQGVQYAQNNSGNLLCLHQLGVIGD